MIKKGDRVKFISDTQSGTVVSINGGIATVMVEDGFEIPTMISDLVAVDVEQEKQAVRSIGVSDYRPGVGGDNRPKPTNRQQYKREVPQYGRITLAPEFDDEEEQADEPVDMAAIRSTLIRNKVEENNKAIQAEAAKAAAQPSPLDLTKYALKLCFVPQPGKNPEDADVSVWLVNDSSYQLMYTFATKQADGRSVKMVSQGTMEDDSKVEIMTITRDQLSRNVGAVISAVLYKPTQYVPHDAVTFEYETTPLKFAKQSSYVVNDYFSKPSIVVSIASDHNDQQEKTLDPVKIIKALKEKGDIVEPRQSQRNSEPEIIDLHAEEVLDSVEGLTPGEILQAQVARFELCIDLALKSGKSGKMVFIHGVGSGKLKYELKRVLTTKYKKIRFQDASFSEYGYGAIMVFLK